MPTTTDIKDGMLPLTVANPTSTPSAAVIVIQEAFGVTSHIKDVTARVADAGYYAVAPHLFHRFGDPVLGYDDYEHVKPLLAALTAEGLTEDIDATIGHLQEHGFAPPQIAIVGFCMGGSVTLYTAATHSLGAAVTFYGGGVGTGRFGLKPLVDYGPELQTPWLGLYGELDTGIPQDQVEQLRAAASTAAVSTEIVTYPGANHGFHCDDRPAVFDPAAAQDGWARTLAWFGAHLPV